MRGLLEPPHNDGAIRPSARILHHPAAKQAGDQEQYLDRTVDLETLPLPLGALPWLQAAVARS